MGNFVYVRLRVGRRYKVETVTLRLAEKNKVNYIKFIKLFYATGFFLYPLKTSENL